MLEQTGKFLRQRYTNASEGVVRTSFFPQEGYNLSISTSRSTDVLRTLQSSDAFLRGFFPDLDDYFPAIHTLQRKDDFLLSSSSIPEVAARIAYGNQEEARLCDPLVDALFPSFSTLQAIGEEVYSAGFCADKQNRTSCAKQLCDIGKAYESTGELTSYPLLNMNLNAVCAVLSCSSNFLFGYHPNQADVSPMYAQDYERGSFGQVLAQKFLSNIREHMEKPIFKLVEYSAHDTTITPLAVTFGDNTAGMLAPPFGAIFVLELLRKNSMTRESQEGKSAYHNANTSSIIDDFDEDEYAVRLLFGHPGLTPETNFTFAFSDFSLQCLNPSINDGEPYVAANNICPLADFERFINLSAPKDPRGLCLVSPSLLAAMDCEPANNTKPSPNDVCLAFRRRCPAEACASGFVMMHNETCVATSGMQITNANGKKSSSGVSIVVLVVLVILAFLIGGLVCYYARANISCFKQKEAQEVQLV